MDPVRLEGESADGARSGVAGGKQVVTPWIYASSGNLRAKHRGEYIDSLGEWFDSLGEWSWFTTRSLADRVDIGFTQPGVGTARHCLRDLIVRTAARRFICVFEMQKRGVPHLHALLETAQPIDGGVEQNRDFNKWGIARWKIYRRGKGAAYYLGKYLGKEMIELYIGLEGPYSEEDVKGRKLEKLRC